MPLDLPSTIPHKPIYLNPSDVFLQLKEKLGELNDSERKYIASQLSKEEYLYPSHITSLELEQEIWGEYRCLYGITPTKLKEFLEDKQLLTKLEEAPDKFIFITCERTNNHDDDRDDEPIYSLNFYRFDEKNGCHERIVKDIYHVIMGWRKNATIKAEKDQKKKEYQEQLDGLIAEFQSGRIDVEKFKEESEKCFSKYLGK